MSDIRTKECVAASQGSRHRAVVSIDTTVSASTTSSNIGLRLSDFPAPPTIPSPASAAFSEHVQRPYTPFIASPPADEPLPEPLPSYAPSAGATGFNPPTRSQRRHAGLPLPAIPNSGAHPPPAKTTTAPLSPFDWHEGSSSIDVQPNDMPLSTSFITSLLPQHSGSDHSGLNVRPGNGSSISNITEVTYLPIPQPSQYTVPPGAAYWIEGRKYISSREDPGTRIVYPLEPNRMGTINSMSQADALVGGMIFSSTSPPESTILSDYRSGQSFLPLLQGCGTNRIEETKVQHPTNVPPSFHRAAQRSSSSASYVSGLISQISRGWSRKPRPLPPVPVVPDIFRRQGTEQGDVSSSVSPQDVAIHGVTDKSYNNSNIENAAQQGEIPADLNGKTSSQFISHDGLTFQFHEPQRLVSGGKGTEALGSGNTSKSQWLGIKRLRLVIIIVVTTIVVIIAVALGVTLGRTKSNSLPNCPTNFTGAVCDLDSTCNCTSGSCIANALISLVPTVNTYFDANFSTDEIATTINAIQGALSQSNCANQAMIVDVGSFLPTHFPNRTTWARSALLWQLMQTMSLPNVTNMQDFLKKTDFSSLSQDGPTTDLNSKFGITNEGFHFDFANQTVTAPPVSWTIVGQPSNLQIDNVGVGSIASKALDRMYSIAKASSTQQHNALLKYWTDSLQQNASDLVMFLAILSASPILLPFDANFSSGSQTISSLLTNSTTQFPPPIACYPLLNPSQVDRITSVEQGVFGLSPVSPQLKFDTSCYEDRPVYGILDVLHLRLPFVDSRGNVSKQGAVLLPQAHPRAIVYSGEILSALPHNPSNTNITLNPLQCGTLNNMDHVILQYLSSIPVNLAKPLIQFVLQNPPSPPETVPALMNSLSSFPALEVAVFGNITTADVVHAVSSFTTPSGDLFFGSDASVALRNWAVDGLSRDVIWTESATNRSIVQDKNSTAFQAVWNPAFTYQHTTTNLSGIVVNVGNITRSFRDTNLFGDVPL